MDKTSSPSCPIPYPFPKLGIFDYALPNSLLKAKERIIWDRNIKFFHIERAQPIGVYVWHENHHGNNKVLYVGCSEKLYSRLYQHCHSVNEFKYKKIIGLSPVLKYIYDHSFEDFKPCNLYPLKCDCLPRYFVRVFFGVCYKEEKELIYLLKPPLNKQIWKPDEDIEFIKEMEKR